MLEILEFIFSEFWIWLGISAFLFEIIVIPTAIIAECVSNTEVKKHEIDMSYEQLERDRCRNENHKTEL